MVKESRERTRSLLILTVLTTLGLVCATACIERPGVQCADGQWCPAGMVCDEARGGCALADRVAACAGKPNLTSCSARIAPSMTYDSARGRPVLFGGRGSGEYADDTWEYDGSNWVRVSTDDRPPSRLAASFAFDEARRRAILFGGDAGGQLDDTWEYDGSQWRLVPSPLAPPAGFRYETTYHREARAVLLFGGAGGGTARSDDTWIFRYRSASPTEARCDDGIDGDGDGLLDCADPDCDGRVCAADARCADESCGG